MRWLAVLVVACSAPSSPVTRVVPPAKRAPPAPVTCADAGVILRGRVQDARDAGPMKEAAIAQACLHDRWSVDVLACIGGTATPTTCLEQLADAQRVAYHARLGRWNEVYPDEVLDDAPVDEEVLAYVDCGTVVGDAARFAPPLAQQGEARALATALRRQQLLALCEHWPTAVRTCFDEVKEPERCRALLEPDQRVAVSDRLAQVDALMTKVTAAKAPACKQVVDVHYADARWKGKLDGMKPSDKTKLVSESRKRMREACIADSWNGSVRGCIAVGGGEPCFVAAGMTASTWGFPPSAIPQKTGIAECDSYGNALRALAACKQLPRQTAQAMLDAFQQTAAALANLPGDARTVAASSCKQADAAIRQSAQSLGCTI